VGEEERVGKEDREKEKGGAKGEWGGWGGGGGGKKKEKKGFGGEVIQRVRKDAHQKKGGVTNGDGFRRRSNFHSKAEYQITGLR